MFQVNQKNIEETRSGIIVAPDQKNAAGHHLVGSLRAGDILFHYNSRLGRTHAVSRIEPVSADDPRLGRWRHRIRQIIHVRQHHLEYEGAHLTLDDEAAVQRRFLVGFTRILGAVNLANHFPRQMIYLREIMDPSKQRLDIVRALPASVGSPSRR